MRHAFPLWQAGALAGCGLAEARMVLPGEVARSTTITLIAMGGGRSGALAIGASTGRFSRRADRLGVIDPLFVSNYGSGGFDIAGSEFSGQLSARCGFGQKQLSWGNVIVTPQQLRQACEFRRNGLPLPATFALSGRGGVLGAIDGRQRRDGRLEYEGVRLEIRSVHRLQGVAPSLQAPVGYSFLVDGRDVGTVDLNGPNKTVYAPADPALREAVLLAALSLAVLWDPAEVDPGS